MQQFDSQQINTSQQIDPKELRLFAENAKSWPFEEARKLVKRLGQSARDGSATVVFETGYGPSGLPHIGTFCEVARTSMVRHAFRCLVEDKIATKLICFSDDMDALRKVPDNIPNAEMLREHIGRSLTSIPDPFGEYPSFGEHNNARLRSFLDQFSFEYDFLSSTACYASGMFDAALQRVLDNYESILEVVKPTLGDERQQSYSPFFPVSPITGHVLPVSIEIEDRRGGIISYIEPTTGERVSTSIFGGAVKCQWKVDWALRWYGLGVDYEMAGKDLSESVKLSSKICRILGARPPEGFSYELFLDQQGKKISKSKGNGLTIDEWLAYATPESLSLFMYNKPRTAKRLYFDVIPRMVEDFQQHAKAFAKLAVSLPGADELAAELTAMGGKLLDNPVWHITKGLGNSDAANSDISFSMLLTLASATGKSDKELLRNYVLKYRPTLDVSAGSYTDTLIDHAIVYCNDFVAPNRSYAIASVTELRWLELLERELVNLPPKATSEQIQSVFYAVGRETDLDMREWFALLYRLLLGTSQGPRWGSFVEIYSVESFRKLLDGVRTREATEK